MTVLFHHLICLLFQKIQETLGPRICVASGCARILWGESHHHHHCPNEDFHLRTIIIKVIVIIIIVKI